MYDAPEPMEHRDKIAWMIESKGWAVVPVGADPTCNPPRAAYAYTVGFETAFGYPEVAVFGLTPAAARGLLGLVVEFLRDGVEPPAGAQFTGLLDNGLRSALLPVDVAAHADLFAEAVDWYAPEPFRMLQLAWPDRTGLLPWEDGFDGRLAVAEPIVGSLEGVA